MLKRGPVELAEGTLRDPYVFVIGLTYFLLSVDEVELQDSWEFILAIRRHAVPS